MQLELPLAQGDETPDWFGMRIWSDMSRHARVRTQQHRNVPQSTVKLLVEFGDEERVRDGLMRYFSKASRDRIALSLGQAFVDNMGPLLRCFLIEGDDGTIITVGHRFRRIRRRVRSNRDRARTVRARRRYR